MVRGMNDGKDMRAPGVSDSIPLHVAPLTWVKQLSRVVVLLEYMYCVCLRPQSNIITLAAPADAIAARRRLGVVGGSLGAQPLPHQPTYSIYHYSLDIAQPTAT